MSQATSQISDAIILLGRSGYSSVPQAYLPHLLAPVQAARLAPQVLMAFTDQDEPALPHALQTCAEAGARRILVQPVYLPADNNLHRWFGKVIMRWHAAWQGPAVEVQLAEPLSEQPELGAALVAILQASSKTAQNVIDNPPEKWEQDPAGWSKIPDHRCQVFFCRGPRCTALGADKLAFHLRAQLKEHKLLQDDRLMTSQSGCLYPCNLGPLMVVHPEGVWYGSLDEATIERIIEEHFVGQQVVEEAVIYRFPK